MEGHVSNTDDYIIWTEDKCLQLIRKFRSKSILWDTKTPLFYRTELKRKVWDNIGKELNMSGAECKHKMGILLSSFRREKAKLKNSLTGHGPPRLSTWFGFKDLAFLINKTAQEKVVCESSLNDNENNDESSADVANSLSETDFNLRCDETDIAPDEDSIDLNLKMEPLSDDDDTTEGDCGTALKIVESTRNKTTNNVKDVDSLTDPLSEAALQNKNKEPSSSRKPPPIKQNDSYKLKEISTFAAFVQAKMLKYSSDTLTRVQKDICEVLFKADQNYYENTDSDGQSKPKKRKLTDD